MNCAEFREILENGNNEKVNFQTILSAIKYQTSKNVFSCLKNVE